jgi:hypothetical protein
MAFFLFSFSAKADVINQKVNFNVNPQFDKYQRTNIGATLYYTSGKTYFYIDDSYWSKLDTSRQNILKSNITLLADDFDNKIYPKETQFWGSEPNPGVDNDPKITILVEDLIDQNGGYFDTANGYTKEQVSNSNVREMIALNADVLSSDVLLIKMFLAHEFQHMISFNQKEKAYNISEDVWLNELRSEYSISKAGYNDTYLNSNLDRRSYILSTNPPDSLTEWPNKNTDYAVVAIFAEYLAEQYGDDILSTTLKYPITGIASINRYLAEKKYNENFGDVYMDWLGALYLNDISKNPKLGYKRTELRTLKMPAQQQISLSPGLREYTSYQDIKDWQPLWLEFDVSALTGDMTKSARIDLNGEAGQNFLGSYLAYYNNGSVESGNINISSNQGSGFVLNSNGKKLQKVVVIATKDTKVTGFKASELGSSLSVKVSMVDTKDVQAGILKDGALIKRPGEKEMYVIWGKYKRYLNPDIIGLYGQLDPSSAIELEPAIFDSYQTSNYVKYVNDEKVYAVWPDGTKHWLNISPKQWDASGRDWNAIFTINELEVSHYRTGTDITR